MANTPSIPAGRRVHPKELGNRTIRQIRILKSYGKLAGANSKAFEEMECIVFGDELNDQVRILLKDI